MASSNWCVTGELMELDEAIRGRRSVRHYTKEDVADELLKEIIEAGTWAPSASNKQLWYFIIVDDDDSKKTLFELGATHVLLSPVSIFVLYGDARPDLKYPDDVESASACIQNMLLKAHDLGLGTCWINHLPSPDKLKDFFNVPGHFKVIAQINIGYPGKVPDSKPRKKILEEIVCYNEFTCDHEKPPERPRYRRFVPKCVVKWIRQRRGRVKHFGWKGLKRPRSNS